MKTMLIPLVLGALVLSGCPNEPKVVETPPPPTDGIKDVLSDPPKTDAPPATDAAPTKEPTADATTAAAVPTVTYYAFDG